MVHRMVMMGVVSLAAVASAQQKPTRAGSRPAFERSDEITLARSAAPAGVTDSARVLVWNGEHYEVAAEGTNGVSCIVSRPWPTAVEPHCYDREGSETVLPIEMRKNELWRQGKSDEAIEREIADGLKTGKYRLPRRPAMTYMMSAANLLFDDTGAPLGTTPHVMIYYPNLSNADVGFPAATDMKAGTVDAEKTPLANLIILMRTSVPVKGKP